MKNFINKSLRKLKGYKGNYINYSCVDAKKNPVIIFDAYTNLIKQKENDIENICNRAKLTLKKLNGKKNDEIFGYRTTIIGDIDIIRINTKKFKKGTEKILTLNIKNIIGMQPDFIDMLNKIKEIENTIFEIQKEKDNFYKKYTLIINKK